METAQGLVLSKKGAFSGTAVKTACGELSYKDFDRRTEDFARGLLTEGAGPGRAVVLHMKRGAEMVIAMFGILKAGAALVPVPYTYPEKRLAAVIRSAGAALVIEEEQFPAIEQAGRDATEPFAPPVAAEEDPAMILYTSGSTGTPKGVVKSQAAIAFLFAQFPDEIRRIGLAVRDFDAVIGRLQIGYVVAYHFEYPTALLAGRTLLLLTEEEQGSIPDTAAFLRAGKRCLLPILPSQLSLYLEEESFRRALSHVSCIAFFAEPVPEALLKKLRAVPGFTGSLVTVYGQTECCGIGWQDFREGQGMVPSPGTEVLPVDEAGKPLPKGEKGELVVHSPSLFTAYLLGDPEKAAEAFSEKNLVIDGKTYIRSGDVGLVTGDGHIELSGRNDRMVKYHGQRIELAEIEAVMKNLQGIRNSCVLVVKGQGGREILAAWYEGEHDLPADSKALKAAMLAQLPAYMIPAVFVRLDQLPLNANGKVDYRALMSMPLPAEAGKTGRPLDEKEQLLADLAAGILGIDPAELGADTSLLACGMDSLTASLLISALSDEGFRLTVDDFIEGGTIEGIAAKLRAKTGSKMANKDVSALVRCTDMQSAWVRNNLQIVENVICFRGMEEDELRGKAGRMAELHPVFRSSFIEDQGCFYTKVLKKRPVRCGYLDIRGLGDGSGELSDAQRRLIVLKANDLFLHPDPTDLLYVFACRTHADKTVLTFRFDHRAVDGMSGKILAQEFLAEGLPHACDNYIAYLEHTADGAVRDEALRFWKDYLAGAELMDVPRNKSPRGKANLKRYYIAPGPERSARIRAYCRERNISAASYVLTRYARAVMEVLGREDLVLPIGVSGRSADVDGMNRIVGCIVNTVPVRVRRSFSEQEFMESCLKADRYGFLQGEVIMRECFGLAEAPLLFPFISSQIFPERIIKEPHAYIRIGSYKDFNRGEFLWEDGEGLQLLLHPDLDVWDGDAVERIMRKTEALLAEEPS